MSVLQLPKPPNPLPPSITRFDAQGKPTLQQIDYDRTLTQFLLQAKLVASISPGFVQVAASGINVNALGDTLLPIVLPFGIGKYLVNGLFVLNPSISLTAAKVGLYTAAAQGGIAIIPQTALSPLTTHTVGTAGSAMAIQPATQTTAFQTATILYLNVGTVQGAAATADFAVSIRPMTP